MCIFCFYSIQRCVEGTPTPAQPQEKGNRDEKTLTFPDDIIIQKTQESTDKLLEIIGEFSTTLAQQRNIQK